jgi:thiamine pyrophosphokinase
VQGSVGTIVVVSSGEPDPAVLPHLPRGAPVVAADGGVDAALALGLEVTVAVGDFDSITAEGLERAERAGARVERHPEAKDATDLELALDAALALAPARIVVVGEGGGRLDHLLAGLLLLGHERYASVEVDALLGGARAHLVRGERALDGTPGEVVSLLPLHGPAVGVTTAGLAFPLRGETLEPGSTRGVSNVFAAAAAHVSLEHGVLAAVRPGRQERSTS